MFNTMYRVIDRMFATMDACCEFVFYYIDCLIDLF